MKNDTEERGRVNLIGKIMEDLGRDLTSSASSLRHSF